MTHGTAPPPSVDGYRNDAQTTIGLRSTKSLSDPNNRIVFKRDVRMSLYRNLETAIDVDAVVAEGLKAFSARVASQPSLLEDESNVADYLAQEIGKQIYSLMLKPEDEGIDLTCSLMSLDMDSLIAIEIRNWWRQNLGLDISVLEIMNARSIEDLGRTAFEGLKTKYGGDKREQGDG